MYRLPGYRSINGIKPNISSAVTGILEAQHTLPYMISFGVVLWVFCAFAAWCGEGYGLAVQLGFSWVSGASRHAPSPGAHWHEAGVGVSGWRRERGRTSHRQSLSDQTTSVAKQQLIALSLNPQRVYSIPLLSEKCSSVFNAVTFTTLSQALLSHFKRFKWLTFVNLSVNDL